MTTTHEPITLTVQEAADMVRVHRNVIYELVKSGEIKKVPCLGRKILIARSELERFVTGG